MKGFSIMKKRGILCGILIILAIPAAVFLFQRGRKREEISCTEQIFAMDTYMEFTAYGKNSEQAVKKAAEKIQDLDALLSTGKEESEIGQLNRKGSLEVSEETASIFQKSTEIYEKTDGLFDFTIYPLIELWGFADKNYHVPSEKELEEVLPLVNASLVKQKALENGRAEVTLKEGQKVDFGGIAKGYASAALMEIYRQEGVLSGIVSLGGNVQVLGEKPDGTGWKIGIRSPSQGSSEWIAAITVKDRAVVTSGGYERFFEENGKTYIHILDPRTGLSADSGLLSVTIVSPDGILADALSTSLYIMGREDAAEYWRTHREEFDMILLDTDHHFWVTEGISDVFDSDLEWETISA